MIKLQLLVLIKDKFVLLPVKVDFTQHNLINYHLEATLFDVF